MEAAEPLVYTYIQGRLEPCPADVHVLVVEEIPGRDQPHGTRGRVTVSEGGPPFFWVNSPFVMLGALTPTFTDSFPRSPCRRLFLQLGLSIQGLPEVLMTTCSLGFAVTGPSNVPAATEAPQQCLPTLACFFLNKCLFSAHFPHRIGLIIAGRLKRNYQKFTVTFCLLLG